MPIDGPATWSRVGCSQLARSQGAKESLAVTYGGVTDPLSNQTSFRYDLFGDLSPTVDANGAATSFTYDDDRNLTGLTDANGSRTVG